MLRELHIRNFAIIEEQCISFEGGLNVLSGETGSGKSIILGALDLVLGGKGKPSLIRSGEESLEVSALLDLKGMAPELISQLPEVAQGEELALSRSLNTNGKGKVYINGRLASVAMLSEIMGRLVNICGQNQHVRLLDPRYHRELIDGFAGNGKLLANYRDLYREFRRLEKLLSNFEEAKQKKLRRLEELQGVVEDLGNMKIYAGVREQLESEVKRLANGEKLLAAVQAMTALFDEEPGIYTSIKGLEGQLSELNRLDEAVAPLAELFAAASTNLEEFDRELRRFASSIELNETLLNEKRDELASIAALERKYRTNDAGLADLLEQSRAELKDLDASSDEATLRAEREKIFTELSATAEKLASARRSASEKIAKQVSRELEELNMKGATLKVHFERENFGADGSDRIEMRISTNKGEPLKALREIASGGELSRILLVLKKILREQSGVNVLVFDEVDSGISGSVARAVGEKLRALSGHSQVICITHLAQIASLADAHLLVEKQIGKRTTSVVRPLTKNERVEEIARMLSGHTITDATRKSARELMA